jgi:hypothetical protein
MTRKDSEKESERPHYYSQFWLDIAAGRRTIGGPRLDDDEASETEIAEESDLQDMPESVSEAETFDDTDSTVNGYQEEIVHPTADEEYSEPEEVLAEENDELEEGDYQEDLPIEDEDIPDMDLSVEEEGNEIVEENEIIEESEIVGEEEEEEDMNWGRGRKKAKPVRPTKAPVKKPGKQRRNF